MSDPDAYQDGEHGAVADRAVVSPGGASERQPSGLNRHISRRAAVAGGATTAALLAEAVLAQRPSTAQAQPLPPNNSPPNTRTFYPEDYGAVGDGSTNDTAAIQDTIDAAAGGGTVQFGPKTYLVNGTPRTDRRGNAILALPINPSGGTLENTYIVLQGAGSGNTMIKTTVSGQSYSATNGPPSILGSPTREVTGAGGPTVSLGVILRGIDFQVKTDASGPVIASVDFGGLSHATVEDCEIWSDNRSVQPLRAHTFGLRMPRDLNSGRIRITDAKVFGFYANIVHGTAHLVLDQVTGASGIINFAMDNDDTNNDPHGIVGKYVSSADAQHHIAPWTASGGVLTGLTDDANHAHYWFCSDCDIEDAVSGWKATVDHLADATNQVKGVIFYQRVTSGVGINTDELTLNGGKWVNFHDLAEGGIHKRDSVFQVTAQATIPQIPNVKLVRVTGTSPPNITSITAGRIGQETTFKFDSTVTVVDGSNLKMAGNFNATADDTLTLVSDGLSWYEISRSAN
jgi:Pectate lyase superfamily protein